MVTLPDPERCPRCKTKGRVIKSRRLPGWRKRRRKCPECGKRWNTYETTINPRRIRSA